MQCAKCEKEIDETVKFCPYCGLNIEKARKDLDDILKLREKEKSEEARTDESRIKSKATERQKSSSSMGTMAVLALLVLAILFLSANETRSVASQEQYQEPVYTDQTSTYNCGFLGIKTCSKQESVFSHYETKYRTVYRDVSKPKFAWIFGLGQSS